MPLFLINIWGLSLPHTFSTFTRTDRRNSKNIIQATIAYICLFAIISLWASKIGMVLIYSFYFFWQQFHYSKQNYGIGRALKEDKNKSSWIDQLFYLMTTLTTLLALFYGGTEQFFGYNLINFFKLSLSPLVAMTINFLILTAYLCYRPKNYLMAISHVLMFSSAYVFNSNFAEGWLYLNVFHNSQYLFFMKNHEKRISFLLYSLALTSAFFLLTNLSFVEGTLVNSFPMILICMLSLNFTHYLFDGMIWKKNVLGK